MAVRAGNRSKAKEVLSKEVIGRIGGEVIRLIRRHHPKIADFVDESEDKKATIRCPIQIDLSQEEPKITVQIGFTEITRDTAVIPLQRSEDPNQMLLVPRAPGEGKKDEELEAATDEAEGASATPLEALPRNSKSRRARGT